MTIHREGFKILAVTLIIIIGIELALPYIFESNIARNITTIILVGFFFIILQFFRNPKRTFVINENQIIAPADGKVVVIEEVDEPEYFKDRRIQISIFMSPFNVHINRFPISGIVKYFKYYPGKFLVAWHPKSSTENERTSVVVENEKFGVLFKQIAGALARRIRWYTAEKMLAKQCAEMGFIKFGSRVDILIPLNSKIKVHLNDKTVGGKTVLAEIL
jgi:phosphatidylserine decarboxylase